MSSQDLSKVKVQRTKRALWAKRSLWSNIWHLVFGERSEKKTLAAKNSLLPEKKFSLELTLNQLRMVNAAVLPCNNYNFVHIGTNSERNKLISMITFEMIKATK